MAARRRSALALLCIARAAVAGDYRVETIVQTGTHSITAIDNLVSLNDEARVAFVATQSGASKLFIADDPGPPLAISFFGAGRVFRGASVNNETVPRVASRDLISGTSFERKWLADGTLGQTVVGRSPTAFDSGLSFVDLNDAGVVAFPALTNGSTNTALFAAAAEPPTLLATYPGSVTLRPQISNDNTIVVRDNTGRIVVWSYPAATVEVVAGGSYTSTGTMPGISPDGDAVAFLGNRGPGPGLFVSVRDGATFVTERLAGDGVGLFTAFDLAQRTGISSVGTYAGGQHVRVVFVGTYGGVLGVYSVDAYLKSGDAPIVQLPRRVVLVGEAIEGRTVQSVSTYDPVNAYGVVAAWVQFTDGVQAVLRAWALPDLEQADATWGAETLGHGANTIAAKGCVLTSCVDVINYFGQPLQLSTDPSALNEWLKDNDGFVNSDSLVTKRCATYARDELGVTLYYRGRVDARDDAAVDAKLRTLTPVELRVNNAGHSVVASGHLRRTGTSTYEVSDPGSDAAGRDTIIHYGNDYQRYRLWSWSDEDDVPVTGGLLATGLESMYLAASDAVHLVLTDPQGRRKGLDPTTGRAYDDVPSSSYGDEYVVDADTGNLIPPITRALEVMATSSGTYRVAAFGTAAGAYQLEVLGFDQDDDVSKATVSGVAAPGQVDVYDVAYSIVPGSSVGVQLAGSCPHVQGVPLLQVSTAALSWSSVPGATGYDVVSGDLGVLRATGSFASATTGCVADDTPTTSVPYVPAPPPGECTWFVVRPVDCAGPTTYDSGAPSQVGSRDADIDASPVSCP